MAESDWEDIPESSYKQYDEWEDVKSLALDTGGIGRPVPRDEARQIAAERVVKRARAAGQDDLMTAREVLSPKGLENNPDAMFATTDGAIPKAMAFGREFARNIPGSFSEPFLRGFEKLASAVGFEEAVKMFGKEGLEQSNPLTTNLGGISSLVAGGKATGGKLMEAKGVRDIIKQGATLGGGIGGVSQLSESIAEGNSPSEIAGRTVLGTGAGVLTGGALAGLPAAASLIGKITAKPKPVQAMANLMKVDGRNQGLIEKYSKGELDEVPSLLKPHFKGSGVEGLEKAEQGLFDEAQKIYQPIIKSSDTGLLKPQNIYELADKNLSKEIGVATDRQKLLSKYVQNFDEITPDNILTEAARANRNLRDFYKQNIGLDSDKEAALKAVRDTYSQLIGQILDQVKAPKEVYSNTGKVNEVVDNILKNFYNQKIKHDATVGGGVRGALTSEVEGLPVTKFQTLERLGKAAGIPMRKVFGGEPERINNQIDSMFKNSINQPLLTPEEKKAVDSILFNMKVREINPRDL